MSAIISAFITGIAAVTVAYLEVRQYRSRLSSERRENLREERQQVQMEMSHASLKLGLVTAKAVLNQKLNGDVEEALEKAQDVDCKCSDFLLRASQAI